MLTVLKRAHDLIVSDGVRGLNYTEFLDKCIDVSPYRNKVYMHIQMNFHRGGSYEAHWLLSTEEYNKVSDAYRFSDRQFYFGDVNGKYSDVAATWSECVRSVEMDPYKIYEIATSADLDPYGAYDATDVISGDRSDGDDGDEEEDDRNAPPQSQEPEQPTTATSEPEDGQGEVIEAIKRPRVHHKDPPTLDVPVQSQQED